MTKTNNQKVSKLKRLSSLRQFVEHYWDEGEQDVVVSLFIDFEKKTMTIRPGITNNKEFGFLDGGMEKAKMWDAVTIAIRRAIQYGNDELYLHSTKDDNQI